MSTGWLDDGCPWHQVNGRDGVRVTLVETLDTSINSWLNRLTLSSAGLASPRQAGATATAPRGNAIDLVLVHDESGSMWRHSGLPPAGAVAARQALELVGAQDDRFGYVGFGSADLDVHIPLTLIAGPADRAALARRIEGTSSHKGWSDYDAALFAAVDAFQKGDGRYARPGYVVAGRALGILFVSDGCPRLDAHRAVQVDDLASFASVDLLRRRRWRVFTIGVGGAARGPEASAILDAVARRTGGRHYAAETPDRLPEAYASIIRVLRGFSA